MFSNLNSLIGLQLDCNKIKIIASNVFKMNSNLKYLNLENNEIEFINKSEFNNMTSLVTIYLKRNKLYNLDTNIVQGCNNLERFCLYGNFILTNITMNFNGLENLDQSLIFDYECWYSLFPN